MGDEVKSIYPSLTTSKNPSQIENHESKELLDKISNQRSILIKSKVEELQKILLHYEKLRSKWNKASTILRVLGTGFGSILAIGGSVTAAVSSAGFILPLVIPAAIAAIGAVQTSTSEIVALTYIKKKINKYYEKCELLNKYINRLYHFYHKAIEDEKITIIEMEEYFKILDEYKIQVDKKQDDKKQDDDNVETKAKIEALKEYNQQRFEDLKKKELERLSSNFRG